MEAEANKKESRRLKPRSDKVGSRVKKSKTSRDKSVHAELLTEMENPKDTCSGTNSVDPKHERPNRGVSNPALAKECVSIDKSNRATSGTSKKKPSLPMPKSGKVKSDLARDLSNGRDSESSQSGTRRINPRRATLARGTDKPEQQ